MTLLPVWCYTYQSSEIVIRSTVSKITLSQAAASLDGALGLYKLYGGFESASSSSIDYLMADDISRNDITVYFKIKQEAKTRTDESIKLSVSAECMVNTDSTSLLSQDPSLLVTTGEPVISNVECLDMNNLKVTCVKETNNEVLFELVYLMGIVEDTNLALFTTTWKKTPGLAPGLYTAKITLSYITK